MRILHTLSVTIFPNVNVFNWQILLFCLRNVASVTLWFVTSSWLQKDSTPLWNWSDLCPVENNTYSFISILLNILFVLVYKHTQVLFSINTLIFHLECLLAGWGKVSCIIYWRECKYIGILACAKMFTETKLTGLVLTSLLMKISKHENKKSFPKQLVKRLCQLACHIDWLSR